MPATLEDLIALGFAPEHAEIIYSGYCKYVYKINNVPIAGFGFVLEDTNLLECWFRNDLGNTPPRALLALGKALIRIISQIPDFFKIVVYRAPNAVAFEKLCQVFGFRNSEITTAPWGETLTNWQYGGLK